MEDTIGCQAGSENVFADLGFADAEERRVKAEMLVEIKEIMKERAITQMKVAEILGVDQPTISKVLRGKMGSITIDRLVGWLTKLGANVHVSLQRRPVVSHDQEPPEPGHLTVGRCSI